MIKKMFFMAMVIACFSAYAIVAQAEPVIVQYAGDKQLTFDVPEDERVVGFYIYYSDSETEWNSDSSMINSSGRWNLTGESPVYTLEEGRLYPGKTYTFTATSHDVAGVESVRSGELTVEVESVQFKNETIPDLYQPVDGPATITINQI